MIEPTHHYADLGDVRLHYVCAGAGDPVVLLHGWPQTWRTWASVLPGLAMRHQVVVPDLRGLGDSSRPLGGYDKKTVAQDIWRLMHDFLGHERFLVGGHDWGGPVAYALAAQHRYAVRAVAVFDAPVPGDGSPTPPSPRWHHGFHNEIDLPEALVVGREDIYLRHCYRSGGARPDAISEEAQREYIRAYRQPGAMRAGFNYYRTMAQDVADNRAFATQGKLEMPVLVYGGGAAGRGMEALESWRRVATDVRGGVAETCGHWIPEEAPGWVIERLLEFFADVRA
ncbi:alpha/beta hydrolase [Nocardia sp. NPDC005998]|uniref:alpha/beta fold hydrolase n=1 Tax=Nocardia sp. NPDC005998 TaxID=3156894 RepID=UPI0033BF8EFC